MKKTLFISFDLIREGEIRASLAIASILAYLRNDSQLRDEMIFQHCLINIMEHSKPIEVREFDDYLLVFDLEKFSYIAISAYIWNEYFLNLFIKRIKALGFRGKIILGGYQITYANRKELHVQYPDVDFFIIGYAEQSLKNLFTSKNENDSPKFLYSETDFTKIPSVYLTREITIPSDTSMVRIETKRGCLYRCSFCAHRNLTTHKISKHPLEKVFRELLYINSCNVKRVNIVDPIFNTGEEYLEVMGEINSIGSSSKYVLQCRLENITGKSGKKFLDLCERGNYHFEFGIQTIDKTESGYINRQNNILKIENSLNQLSERNISYEISLIYGLPHQTVDSFRRSIEYIKNKGCKIIKAYPLMLLRGTELFYEKQKWGMIEELMGDFAIPTVTSSNSFSRQGWLKMNKLADELMPHDRY